VSSSPLRGAATSRRRAGNGPAAPVLIAPTRGSNAFSRAGWRTGPRSSSPLRGAATRRVARHRRRDAASSSPLRGAATPAPTRRWRSPSASSSPLRGAATN